MILNGVYYVDNRAVLAQQSVFPKGFVSLNVSFGSLSRFRIDFELPKLVVKLF